MECCGKPEEFRSAKQLSSVGYHMSTYLITGGTGLVGNYVIRELLNREHDADEIIVYDLYPNEEVIADVAESITLVRGDVTDTVQLMETFSEHEPDRVIHLAAYVTHQSWENPTETIEVNGVGTNNVFDAVRIFDSSTCLFASSASVYGTPADYDWNEEPIVVDEEVPVKPQNPYAVTKYMNEVMARTYAEKYDPNYVGVRIGGVWGRGRSEGATGQLNSFVKRAGLGNDVTVPTYWTVWDQINLSYGKDVGRWFVNLVDRDEFEHHIYNQGNRESYPFDRIVETLHELQPEITIEYPDPDEMDDWAAAMTNPRLNCTRWYDELGLTQEWEVRAAVVDYVNHHRRKQGREEISL